MIGLMLIATGAMMVLMLAMAIGVIFNNRPLRGSCGGVAAIGPDGEPLTCSGCNCKLPEEAAEAAESRPAA